MICQWKNYWRSYNTQNPLINIWVLVTVLILLVVGLTGVSIKTGKYVKILESNVTTLKSELSNCLTAQEQSNADLETCSLNLQGKISSLTSCQTERNNLNDKLTICTKDLTKCEDNYDELKIKYSQLKDDYDECKDDLRNSERDKNNLQSSFEQLKLNYINDYVGGFCCLKFKNTNTSKTYYIFSNNDITCFNTTFSGAIEYSC